MNKSRASINDRNTTLIASELPRNEDGDVVDEDWAASTIPSAPATTVVMGRVMSCHHQVGLGSDGVGGGGGGGGWTHTSSTNCTCTPCYLRVRSVCAFM